MLHTTALLQVAGLQQAQFFTAQSLVQQYCQNRPVAHTLERFIVRSIEQTLCLVVAQGRSLALFVSTGGLATHSPGCARPVLCCPGGNRRCWPAPPVCVGSWPQKERAARAGRARLKRETGSRREALRHRPGRQICRSRADLPSTQGACGGCGYWRTTRPLPTLSPVPGIPVQSVAARRRWPSPARSCISLRIVPRFDGRPLGGSHQLADQALVFRLWH